MSMTLRRAHLLALLLVTPVLGSALRAQPVETPNFEGYWMPSMAQSITWPYNAPPFTEYGQAQWDAYVAEFDPAVDDPSRLCVPEAMPRSMVQPPFPVEIIQRDRDLTMFFEAWSQYRKIHMADHDYPLPALRTRMGHSVAHWEGDALVIHTTHLTERTMGKILMSGNARVEEVMRIRMTEDGRRQLVNDITFFDEQMYTEPVHTRGVWNDSPDTPVLEYVCSEEIWERYVDTLREEGVRIF